MLLGDGGSDNNVYQEAQCLCPRLPSTEEMGLSWCFHSPAAVNVAQGTQTLVLLLLMG